MLILDADGVFTDGRVYYEEKGPCLLSFDIQDGHGIRMAGRAEDFRIGLITARENPILATRARELGIEEIVQGARKKIPAFEAMMARARVKSDEVAYMGDDVVDLPVLRRAGLPIAPANAVPDVKRVAALVTSASGGNGAIREVLEEILKAQGKWQGLMRRYREPTDGRS